MVRHCTFGQRLKALRLEARMGLRTFADLIEMAPPNLSNIERDRAAPPADHKKIKQICDALGLASEGKQRIELFDLAAEYKNRIPADVAKAAKTNPAIPVLVRTVANKKLSSTKLQELTDYIKEHY